MDGRTAVASIIDSETRIGLIIQKERQTKSASLLFGL
jgi:hypothetical protein